MVIRRHSNQYRVMNHQDGVHWTRTETRGFSAVETEDNIQREEAVRRQGSGMQNNLMASVYHVCSTNNNPNHHMCPSDDNSWCGYNRNKDTFRHVHGLPEAIVELVEPIYNKLTSPDLLKKCLHGMTQNNNECLNKLIWDRCPKETFVSRLAIEDATYSAVSYFNDGNASVIRVFSELGVSLDTTPLLTC